jgi:hypothetical protein
MIDQIKSQLITAYILFVNEFGDTSGIDKKELEGRIHCKVEDMFKRQRLADLAKKRLGDDFPKALALYFGRFLNSDGFDHVGLSRALRECEKALALHMRKDSLRYLKLLASVMSLVDDKPKGLLAS